MAAVCKYERMCNKLQEVRHIVFQLAAMYVPADTAGDALAKEAFRLLSEAQEELYECKLADSAKSES